MDSDGGSNRSEDNMKIWGIVGYAALALTAVGILVNLKDIKRYIRISTM
jgi:hypothetical protein